MKTFTVTDEQFVLIEEALKFQVEITNDAIKQYDEGSDEDRDLKMQLNCWEELMAQLNS